MAWHPVLGCRIVGGIQVRWLGHATTRIVSDHGTEFTSNAMLQWTQAAGVSTTGIGGTDFGGIVEADEKFFRNRPLSTAPQAAFGVASRLAFQFQGSSSSRRLGSWVRMQPRMSAR